MADEADLGEIGQLGELFRKSFPDVSCLRCGNDEFWLLPASREGFWAPFELKPRLVKVVTVACTRCGYLERHLTEQLENAPKPIEITKNGTP